MKDIQLKIKHIFIPFVMVMLVTLIGYSALRWLLDIKLGILPIQEFWLDFMFPMGASYLTVSIWMNKRFQILDIDKDKTDLYFSYKMAMVIKWRHNI